MVEAPKSKFATVNGIRMHYLEWGKPSNHDLLLVHGWTSWAQSWNYVAEKLQDKYHIIAPDHRGHGESDKPETGYRLRDFAEDMHQLVNKLELKKPFYAGNSWGGCTGTVLAADYPQDFSKMILGDPVYWKMQNEFVTSLPTTLKRRHLSDDELRAELKKQGMTNEAMETELIRLRKFSEAALTHLLSDNRDFARDCEDYVRRIKVPTMIIVGDFSVGGKIMKEEADYMGKIASPLVTFNRWPGVGHGVLTAKPDEYIKTMVNFYESK